MSGCEGSEPFALRVLGDSMEPEFNEGEVIIIEPGTTCQDGAYVMALHNNEYLFRQLLVRQDQCYLRPLNDRYPMIQAGPEQIKGRIISKSSGKGRQSKSYL